jgi:hypothetical protein
MSGRGFRTKKGRPKPLSFPITKGFSHKPNIHQTGRLCKIRESDESQQKEYASMCVALWNENMPCTAQVEGKESRCSLPAVNKEIRLNEKQDMPLNE